MKNIINRSGKLISYKDAAELLGLPLTTLYSMVSREEIPHYRITGKTVLFDSDELTKWLEARLVKDKRQES